MKNELIMKVSKFKVMAFEIESTKILCNIVVNGTPGAGEMSA